MSDNELNELHNVLSLLNDTLKRLLDKNKLTSEAEAFYQKQYDILLREKTLEAKKCIYENKKRLQCGTLHYAEWVWGDLHIKVQKRNYSAFLGDYEFPNNASAELWRFGEDLEKIRNK